MPVDHGHQRSDLRNLHLHRAALARLAREPELRARCLRLVERWCALPEQAPSLRWLEAWREMLDRWPIERIAEIVLDPQRGQSLRQCSPLAPTLTPRERWRLLAQAKRSDTESSTIDPP